MRKKCPDTAVRGADDVFGRDRGSYANKLENERARLLRLKDVSSNPLVHRWVDKTVSRFDNAIVAERRRDANRDADFKK